MSEGRKRHHNALPEGYKLHWYEIHSILGRGGFGITYLATDTNLNHEVAIKEFLPTELAMRADDSSIHPISDDHTDTFGWGLNRFITEAQTLAQFRHPNIVLVHSVFEANGTAYMVMEYESGKSLEQAYKFKSLATEEELLRLMLPLMDGLERIHQAGFVHRDIKPKNIYLREDGRPVLLDFGSARQALGVETRTLTTLVSPGYAPFEQYNATRDSDKQGPWTDIYALGATIYRGLSGKSPVDALSRANAKLEGKNDVLEPATEVGKERFSHEFLAAIDWALAFSPEERPQSVADWRAMLPEFEQSYTAASAGAHTARATDFASQPTVARAPEDPVAATEAATEVAEDAPAEDRFTDDGTLILEDGAVDRLAAEAAEPAPSANKRPWLAMAALVTIAAIGLAVWQLGEQTTQRETGSPAPSDTRPQAGSDAAPKPNLATITPLLGTIPCSVLQASVNDGTVQIRGYAAGEDNAARVQSALTKAPGVAEVRADIQVLPRIQCAVLELYAPHWKANRTAVHGTSVGTPQLDNEFREGEHLIVDITPPGYESYLYVDYFALDGSVVHMLPSPGEEENRLPGRDAFLVGEPGDIGLWEVAPPFGTELIVILASREAVFTELREQVERADVYLDALRKRLETLETGSGKGKISADFVVIKTRPAS